MKKNTILISCLGFFLLSASLALAGPSPKQVIQENAEKIRVILSKKAKKGSSAEKQQKEELKKVVDGFLDYQELSRKALGVHWKDRTPKEREEFVQMLRDLIEASYTSPISDNIDFKMEYDEEEVEEGGSKASVVTVASAKTKKGKTVSEDLTFHLFLTDQKWMIFDVDFGDISLVRHYRKQFDKKIKKESYPALVAAMKKKIEEVKSGKIEKQPKL